MRKSPRYIDIDKCTGCGECCTVTLNETITPTEVDGDLWVDRIQIDESKCIHCGECIQACREENGPNQALTSIVQQRIESIPTEGTVPPEVATEQLAPIQKLLNMTREERESFWQEQFQKCIRCYGCFMVCPVHLGEPEELSLSKWLGKDKVPPSYPLFHLLRAYQVWDTCVLCGECEATCPASIPLKLLQDIVCYFPPEKVFELVPGLEPQVQQAILDYAEQREGSRKRVYEQV